VCDSDPHDFYTALFLLAYTPCSALAMERNVCDSYLNSYSLSLNSAEPKTLTVTVHLPWKRTEHMTPIHSFSLLLTCCMF
jgi:hypothetical protein